MSRTQPNDRSQRSAAKLLGNAKDVTRAVERIRDELSGLGFPSASAGPKVSGGSTSSSTERHAETASRWSALREDLRDALTDVEQRIDALVRLTKHILGEEMPNADGESLCCDKQQGREGVLTWGDPLCTELPLGGWQLCPRCTKRETRWRTENGLKFRGEDAA